jgi:hypothetical protein
MRHNTQEMRKEKTRQQKIFETEREEKGSEKTLIVFKKMVLRLIFKIK